MITIIALAFFGAALFAGGYYLAHKANPTATQEVIDSAKKAATDEVKKVL